MMSMVGYVLGLGDRHPSNIMMQQVSGRVVHIDFGDCFEVAMLRERFPEKVPFRLTRMLVNAMEVCGVEGTYRDTCEKTLTVMRDNRGCVLAMLDAFVHDPLINWRLLSSNSHAAGSRQERANNNGGGSAERDGGKMAAHQGSSCQNGQTDQNVSNVQDVDQNAAQKHSHGVVSQTTGKNRLGGHGHDSCTSLPAAVASLTQTQTQTQAGTKDSDTENANVTGTAGWRVTTQNGANGQNSSGKISEDNADNEWRVPAQGDHDTTESTHVTPSEGCHVGATRKDFIHIQATARETASFSPRTSRSLSIAALCREPNRLSPGSPCPIRVENKPQMSPAGYTDRYVCLYDCMYVYVCG